MAYDGFISYSHAADGQLAPALQRGLQLLAKPWNSRRALRIFRDETGLATNPHLWSAIEKALDESEWFVLLASEEAAQSEWVNREITHWLATKRVEHILPVVTDGTWDWDPVQVDFTRESSAVPEVLRGALRDEPRHLDLRWARSETDLDLRSTRFRSAVADLAAPMHGVAKDELEGEDIRQHRHARRLARGAVGALVLLVVIAVVVSIFAVGQRDSARNATAEANQRLLVAESQGQLSTNRQLATLLAIEADRRSPSAETRNALMNAVLAEPSLQRTFGGPVLEVEALAGNRVAVLSTNRVTTPNRDIVQVWNWRTGRREPWRDAPLGDAYTGPLYFATSSGGSLLAVMSTDGMVQMYSGRTLEPEGPPFAGRLGQLPPLVAGGPPVDMTFSSNEEYLAIDRFTPAATGPYAGRSMSVFSRPGDQWVPDPLLDHDLAGPIDGGFLFSSDGSVLATSAPTASGDEIAVYDVGSGRKLLSVLAGGATTTGMVGFDWPRRRVVLATSDGAVAAAVWYDLNTSDPAPHTIMVGSGAGGGNAGVAYDPSDNLMAVDSNNGLEIFDAATLTPVAGLPVFPTNESVGWVIFPASGYVLTSSDEAGPMSVWDLSGTSVLATAPRGHFSFVAPTSDHHRFLGYSTSGDAVTVTVLGPGYRPLGAPIAIEKDVQALPAGVQTNLPLACLDPRRNRIATVSFSTGDVVVRGASPPFPVLSTAPGVLSDLPYADLCAWSPNGRYIAIATYPQGTQTASASAAVYDVSSRTLRVVKTFKDEIAVTSLVWSPDSESLWAGGPTLGVNGVYRISDIAGTPRVRAAFSGAFAISADADGRRLVVAYESSVREFDARSERPITQSISLPTSAIIDVDSSPDGSEALVTSTTGWRLVDMGAAQPISPWIPVNFPSLAALGSDETTVYSEDLGANSEVWDVSPFHLRQVACSLAGRNLTEQEWQEYLSWAGPRDATCPQYPLS